MDISITDQSLDFPKQLTLSFLNAIKEGEKNGYKMIWDIILNFISQNTLYVILTLVLVLSIAFVDYKISGRWRSLGSVLYNYFYFGSLFIITLIFGPEIFANDLIKIGTFALYITCFILVGKVLKKAGIHKVYPTHSPRKRY